MDKCKMLSEKAGLFLAGLWILALLFLGIIVWANNMISWKELWKLGTAICQVSCLVSAVVIIIAALTATLTYEHG
jgi:hypothetical protein